MYGVSEGDGAGERRVLKVLDVYSKEIILMFIYIQSCQLVITKTDFFLYET